MMRMSLDRLGVRLFNRCVITPTIARFRRSLNRHVGVGIRDDNNARMSSE